MPAFWMRLKAGIIYQEGQKSFHELNKYRDTNTMHPEPFEFYIDIFVLISRGSVKKFVFLEENVSFLL